MLEKSMDFSRPNIEGEGFGVLLDGYRGESG